MLSILYTKFLDHLASMSLYNILRSMSRLSLSIVLLIFLVDIPSFIENASIALKWHDFILVKVFASLFVVY